MPSLNGRAYIFDKGVTDSRRGSREATRAQSDVQQAPLPTLPYGQ